VTNNHDIIVSQANQTQTKKTHFINYTPLLDMTLTVISLD